MTTLKTHRFPVDVRWTGGRLTEVTAAGKPSLTVATPPEFRGGVEGVWSPEDLFVAAVASCYVVTLASVAERRSVPLRALEVRSAGYVTQRADGRFGFIAVDLEISLRTDPGWERQARDAAHDAERACLVAASLDTPVRVAVEVTAAPAAA
jgi:organic hydroperoxide reductase OsmC/OhrA